MSYASALRSIPGKHGGKRNELCVGLWGSKEASNASPVLRSQPPSLWLTTQAENRGFRALSVPKVAENPLHCAFRCFPPASPALAAGSGKQKRPRRAVFIRLKSLGDFGAGEGIRTLDPNLGKVVRSLRWSRRPSSPVHH